MATITVLEWQRTLLFTDGRFARILEPGRHRYARHSSTFETVDMRRRLTVVNGQELLTADGLTLRLSAQVTWRVADPVAFVTVATMPDQVLYTGVQLALRDVVAAGTLDELVADRGRLTVEPATIAAHVDGLGIELLTVAVRDVMLPGELRRAAVETLLAREKGKAELERARAEAASLRTLANVARVLEEHPALLHLRTIQAASTPGTTVVLTQDPGRIPSTT
jgi:regulator of protease activity HflC (stomatin/prohibitin superfamily)